MEDLNEDKARMASWFILVRALSLSPGRFHELLSIFGDPFMICQASARQLSDAGLDEKTMHAILNPNQSRLKQDMEWLKLPENHLITILDADYPELLKQIAGPPIALHVKGNKDVLHNLQVSVVGSRRPTPDGRRIAYKFSSQLAQSGLTVTSGLAYGIDSWAHKGALSVTGPTIAVLGNGLETIYPKSHLELAKSICENGAIVSEFPLNRGPTAKNFPIRNRIISGLSVGTLVIEAAIKSGSLITARLALEQGREVFAAPGCVLNPLSKGCHELIRHGAILVDKIEDIFAEFGPLAHFSSQARQQLDSERNEIKILDEKEKLLLDNIGSQPISLDSLVELTRLEVSDTTRLLLTLELNGIIESLPDGGFMRC